MGEQFSQPPMATKPFYMDQNPLVPANCIFDNTYRNISQKRKFEKDPKYTYFNTLIKMKNNYLSKKRDLYQYVFKNDKNDDDKMEWRSQKNLQDYDDVLEPRQTFHVEKINNHAFKIYKGKSGSSQKAKLAMDMTSAGNMNFKINFRNNKQPSKPQIEQVMKQYRKMNAPLVKKPLSPNTSATDFTDSNRNKLKSSHKYSFAAQGSFMGVGGGRNRSMTANKVGDRSHHFNF